MKKNALMTVLAFSAILCSCDYRNLAEMEILERGELTLRFQHDRVDSVPAEYRVAFYPADERTLENITSGYMLYDIRTGDHHLDLPSGNYKVTAWNHDTEHVMTNGYGIRDLVTATTQKYISRGLYDIPKVVDSLYHDKTILDYPDYMVHANVEDFFLEAGNNDQVLVLHPDSMVIAVDMDIKGIRGLGEVTEVRGSISNVAGKRYIAPDNLTEDSVVVMYDCKAITEENRVAAHFHLFGLEPTNAKGLSHKVLLYFWLRTGIKVYIPIDVTNLIRNAKKDAARLNIHIEDMNVDLREYMAGTSGYEVAVDDWDNIIVGIDL